MPKVVRSVSIDLQDLIEAAQLHLNVSAALNKGLKIVIQEEKSKQVS